LVLAVSYPTTRLMERDIVVRDTTGRELYREGPYDGTSVERSMERIVAQIEKLGLEGFMRDRHRESGQLGAFVVDRATSGQQTVWYVGAVVTTLKRKVLRRGR
jgi:hypothetical protein